MPNKRTLMVFVRILISLVLLTIIFLNVDFKTSWEYMKLVTPGVYLTVVGCLALSNCASAVRWHMILNKLGSSPGIFVMIKILAVGLFFNQILPSAVGGDLIRVYRCRLVGVELLKATKSVLIERFIGFLTMLSCFVICSVILTQKINDPSINSLLIMAPVFSALALLLFLSLDKLPAPLINSQIAKKVVSISFDARQVLRSKELFLKTILCSLISIFLLVLGYLLFSLALNLPLDFFDWLIIGTLVNIVSILPISLAGWGVREGIMITLLMGYGVSTEIALAISLLYGLSLIGIGLPGSLILLGDWDIKK